MFVFSTQGDNRFFFALEMLEAMNDSNVKTEITVVFSISVITPFFIIIADSLVFYERRPRHDCRRVRTTTRKLAPFRSDNCHNKSQRKIECRDVCYRVVSCPVLSCRVQEETKERRKEREEARQDEDHDLDLEQVPLGVSVVSLFVLFVDMFLFCVLFFLAYLR